MSDGSRFNASVGDDMHCLYRDHSQWLSSWIRRRLGDRERAADITQDTFVRLISSALTRIPQEPRSYLATVAKRLMIDQLRRRQVEQTYLQYLANEPEAQACSPEHRLIIVETLMQLDAMLDGLGSNVRQAFFWVQLDGLSYAEVATRLNVSVSSVTKYMAKATERCLFFELDSQA
ncbi:sigma-70 family RNA polymerase sigma factor [Pseudomonas sp. S31]|uniref:sigma-70 family RNA polymerase sigma factor n=1 Tax=Pseudomonas sp. S31 TaxID=1564473 RepID=UPI001912F126|nr:sigma-70 family RNA polymerase sigma factor [Pseudomonas sp. S31]MBK4999725.1 sigma-70 family RNA polymerase sigma factor [Pseudomonas sp. S31]